MWVIQVCFTPYRLLSDFRLLASLRYSAELSPKGIRGTLVAFTEIAINIGILLGYGLGWSLASLPLNTGWRWMLAIGAFPPGVILVALIWMPESPRHLFAKGHIAAAAAVLLKASGPEEARDAMHTLQELQQQPAGGWRDFFRPSPTTKALLVAGLGTSFFQQITGVEAQVYYTPVGVVAMLTLGLEQRGEHGANREGWGGRDWWTGALLGGIQSHRMEWLE